MLIIAFTFSDRIYPVALYDKWRSFQMSSYKLTTPITEELLYNMAISSKILAFSFALCEIQSDEICALFRIIEHPGVSFAKEMESHYLKIDELPAAINVPLNVFKPKKFHIEIVADVTRKCDSCAQCLYSATTIISSVVQVQQRPTKKPVMAVHHRFV